MPTTHSIRYLALAGIPLILASLFAIASITHAAALPSYVHVATSTNSVQVSIDNPPNNSSEQVFTTYTNGHWHTYATTTSMTKADTIQLQQQFAKQQQQLNELFATEQKLFAAQQRLFDQWLSTTTW